jgi:hypothetical protein
MGNPQTSGCYPTPSFPSEEISFDTRVLEVTLTQVLLAVRYRNPTLN